MNFSAVCLQFFKIKLHLSSNKFGHYQHAYLNCYSQKKFQILIWVTLYINYVSEFHSRLSIQIGATEEHLGPDPSKFREGHTKVSDVERIYLTGKYKEKYKTISNYYNAPESLKHKVYPVMENGTRKVRSAYPSVVRVKSSRMSHHANACIYANEDHVREISIKSAALSRINC